MQKICAKMLIAGVFLAAASPSAASASTATAPSVSNAEQTVNPTNAKPATDKPEKRAWIEIPEPSNLVMLALGIAGLITGRYAARRRKKSS